MRRSLAAVVAAGLCVALVACGGKSKKESTVPAGSDFCIEYRLSVSSFLERLDKALDEYLATAKTTATTAKAARKLSDAIDGELVGMQDIQTDDQRIGDGHLQLVSALDASARSLGALWSAFEIGDQDAYKRARDQLAKALLEWDEAVRNINGLCPE